MTQTQFQTFIANGAVTRAGFAIDPTTVVYNNNSSGAFDSVRANVIKVTPQALGLGYIGTLMANNGKTQTISVVWDTNGNALNYGPIFSLVSVAPTS